MNAVCVAEDEAATARGSSAGSTMFGKSVCTLGASNARPPPMMKTIARINCGVSQLPPQAGHARQAAKRRSVPRRVKPLYFSVLRMNTQGIDRPDINRASPRPVSWNPFAL